MTSNDRCPKCRADLAHDENEVFNRCLGCGWYEKRGAHPMHPDEPILNSEDIPLMMGVAVVCNTCGRENCRCGEPRTDSEGRFIHDAECATSWSTDNERDCRLSY